MKKSDLKTGMYLRLDIGRDRIVMLNTTQGDITVDKDIMDCDGFHRLYDHYSMDCWDKNLETRPGHCIGNVIEVFNSYGVSVWKKTHEVIITLDGVDYSESTLRSMIKKATEEC